MRRPLDHDVFEIVGLRRATRTAGRWVFAEHEHILWSHEDRIDRPAVEHLLAIEITLKWLRRCAMMALWRYWIFPHLLGNDRERARHVANCAFQWRWMFGRGAVMRKARGAVSSRA